MIVYLCVDFFIHTLAISCFSGLQRDERVAMYWRYLSTNKCLYEFLDVYFLLDLPAEAAKAQQWSFQVRLQR